MKKKPLLCLYSLFFISWFSIQLTAQNLEEPKVKTLPFYIFKTNDSLLNLNSILESTQHFLPPEHEKNSTRPQNIYWIKLDLKKSLDSLNTQHTWRLETPIFDKAALYFLKNDTISFQTFGTFDNTGNLISNYGIPNIELKKENLIDSKYLYIRAEIFSRRSNIYQWDFTYIPVSSNKNLNFYYPEKFINILISDYTYSGACIIILLLFFAIYIYSGRKQFLYYALYVLASIIYLIRPNFNNHTIIDSYNSHLGHWVAIICQVFINLFYIVFAIYYLGTKKNYPKLHKSILFIVFILFGIIFLDAFVFFLGDYESHIYILDFQRLAMTIWGLIAMVYLSKNAKNLLAYFIVAGSFSYMAGALGYLFFENRYYMILGSITEILIFSLGLAYKIKLEYEEKLYLKREVSEKEHRALRAQMNPHFIFNALSAIQNLILKNDRMVALEYLSKFGKLSRGILESSFEKKVLLADEIKLLNSYLELESLRFNGVFNYKICISKDLDTNDTEIPFMITQPFIENAIIHGLNNKKEGDKNLLVSFCKNGETLICEIEDNGIGRVLSNKMNSTLKKHKTSRGIEIIKRRLQVTGNSDLRKNTIEIIDKYDKNNNPLGTKVTIKIIDALNPTV
ncbi:hypothetical protein HME9304_01926 [Flagellimonas maritima]|uniref:Signal transduction histidine kinase internal region domain-containing protein n=1 Tax=Flagellimonas maritima TaxID=1383885 RepID=A0A2Z4LTA5_9FLAO|nr:histidine kinase [Allomuricauda aurantiaca]AWX44920.1 hypothetical protein HME9304_01926 [Allomuricauda aurantiaca]